MILESFSFSDIVAVAVVVILFVFSFFLLALTMRASVFVLQGISRFASKGNTYHYIAVLAFLFIAYYLVGGYWYQYKPGDLIHFRHPITEVTHEGEMVSYEKNYGIVLWTRDDSEYDLQIMYVSEDLRNVRLWATKSMWVDKGLW